MINTSDGIIIGKKAPHKQSTLDLVDRITKYRGPDRWLAIRREWLKFQPAHLSYHIEAVQEASKARADSLDKKFGRSKAALGLAHDQKSNGNSTLRAVSVMPTSLVDWLMHFDYLNLGARKGKENTEIWQMVYKTFPEYKIPEKI